MDPRFNGPPGGGAPVVHRVLNGQHVIASIVFLVLVMLVLTLLFFLLYRLLRHSSGWWGTHSAAIRELEMRYARGEIGREEFLQRRADLVAPAVPPNLPPPSPPAGGAPPAKPPARGAKPTT